MNDEDRWQRENRNSSRGRIRDDTEHIRPRWQTNEDKNYTREMPETQQLSPTTPHFSPHRSNYNVESANHITNMDLRRPWFLKATDWDQKQEVSSLLCRVSMWEKEQGCCEWNKESHWYSRQPAGHFVFFLFCSEKIDWFLLEMWLNMLHLCCNHWTKSLRPSSTEEHF